MVNNRTRFFLNKYLGEQEKEHEGMTKGLLSLIPEEGDTKDLNYWRPIQELPIFEDVISPEQIAWFILDNIVLTHETLQWTRSFIQPTVFFRLKLNFLKAYKMCIGVSFFMQWIRWAQDLNSFVGFNHFSEMHQWPLTLTTPG